MSSVPGAPAYYGDGDSPFERQQREQQHGYRFSGRILLTAVIVLAIVTIVFFLVRVLLVHFMVDGGRGGSRLATGLRRSFGRLSSSRRGLDAAALAALPVTAYSKEEGAAAAAAAGASTSGGAGAGATDCAVCLSELAEGDKVRALPGCGHVFHVECVDAWLRTRTTCPVCRAEVTPPPTDNVTEAVVVTVVEGGAAQTRGSRTSVSLGSGQPAGASG